MSERCPYCARPLEEDTLTGRILSTLAEGTPLAPAGLARILGARRTMVYQAIRRLRERGSIVKRQDPMTGEWGWGVPDFPVRPESEEASRRSEAVDQLIQEIQEFRIVTVERAKQFLVNQGAVEEGPPVDELIEYLRSVDLIEINGEAVSA